MNVILLILDALRKDAVTEEKMPHLHGLASQNLSFDRCVTPANWSLPAHASLFTGEWPHEHGYYHREHHINTSPLVVSFNQRGYTTVGISANIYASGSHGFSTGFDEFYETRRPLKPSGLNPFANVRQIQEDRTPGTADYLRTFVDAVTHDHPIESVENYLRAIALELDRRYSLRSSLPVGRDDRYGFLTRASARSTSLLSEVIARNPTEDLFVFVNLMDTHYPYEPPQTHLDVATDGQLSTTELKDISPDVGSPKTFLNHYYHSGVDSDLLELIRAAYHGEAHSVDARIKHIIDLLEQTGQREETLVIVTSDHGECLGEQTLRNERGMGHYPFLSEELWRVPLIVAHPRIQSETVTERVSLKSIFDLLTDDPQEFVRRGVQTYQTYFDTDPVFFELPANPYHESTYDQYEHIPESFIEWEVSTHAVVGFDGDWRVCAESTGNTSAWYGTEEVQAAEAPDSLVSACRSAVTQYPEFEAGAEHAITERHKEQLEKLGYL